MAFSLLNFDSAASISALEITFFDTRSRARSKSVRASSASACADRNNASSWETSSLTSTSPFFACAPFSNRTSPTVPPSSVDTTAPCAALTDPTADSLGAQSSSFTVALVTVTEGIIFGLLIILPICSALMPKTKITIATSRPIAMPRPLRRGLTFDCVETPEIVFATSCISQFCLRFEQQAPEPPRHFQLPRSPFRCGRLLGAQHIEHQHSTRDRVN